MKIIDKNECDAIGETLYVKDKTPSNDIITESQKKKEYYKKHKMEILKRRKIYHQNNREKILKKFKEYWKSNKSELCKKQKEYRKNNIQKIKLHNKNRYNKSDKKLISIKRKNYYLVNKSNIISRVIKYEKKRMETDLNFKLRKRLKCRLKAALNGNYKSGSAINNLGCSIDDFKLYIELKFNIGMSWENYGKWHIDHIRPCSSFDLTKEDEQRKCFHYTNLQPLWAKDNLVKGNRW